MVEVLEYDCYIFIGEIGGPPLSSGQWHHVALVFRTSDPTFSGGPSGGSADGKSALLSGKQIPVNGGHPLAEALHTEVTLNDGDRPHVIFQWLP